MSCTCNRLWLWNLTTSGPYQWVPTMMKHINMYRPDRKGNLIRSLHKDPLLFFMGRYLGYHLKMNFLYIYSNTILPWDSGVKKYLVYSRRGLNEADLGMKPYNTEVSCHSRRSLSATLYKRKVISAEHMIPVFYL